jgi:peptide/nickel transport system ATP-binding protein
MRSAEQGAVLTVKDLRTVISLDGRERPIVDEVSFELFPKQTLGLIGESGSGKTMTALSLLRLIAPPMKITGGQIIYRDRDLAGLPMGAMRELRGSGLAMIFQNPRDRFDPLLTISKQIIEVLLCHHVCTSRRDATRRALELLDEVKVPAAGNVMHMYPNELSGGMLQRVMIGIAIAASPDILIADEPTSSLDVTVQAEVLDLLMEVQRLHHMSMIFITHDIAVARQMADQVAVMYAAQIIEMGDASEVLVRPRHPYTQALLAAIPTTADGDVQAVRNGATKEAGMPSGCRFGSRCGKAKLHGKALQPPPLVEDEHGMVRCWLYEQTAR